MDWIGVSEALTMSSWLIEFVEAVYIGLGALIAAGVALAGATVEGLTCPKTSLS